MDIVQVVTMESLEQTAAARDPPQPPSSSSDAKEKPSGCSGHRTLTSVAFTEADLTAETVKAFSRTSETADVASHDEYDDCDETTPFAPADQLVLPSRQTSTVVYCLSPSDPPVSVNAPSTLSLIVSSPSDAEKSPAPVVLTIPNSGAAATATSASPSSTSVVLHASEEPVSGTANQLVGLPGSKGLLTRLPPELEHRQGMTVITIDPSSGRSLYSVASQSAPVVLGLPEPAKILPNQEGSPTVGGSRTLEVCGACGGVMPPGASLHPRGASVISASSSFVVGRSNHKIFISQPPTEFTSNTTMSGSSICATKLSLKGFGEVVEGDDISRPSRSSTNSSLETSSGATVSGDICRICHCEGEYPDAPLIAPCYCTGSLRWVHQSCLQQWIKSSETKTCELCKFEFIMETKIKPFQKWEKLQMTTVERRKIMCSVTFHVIAITCVIWSLYVLIDRTTDEVRKGNLEWPFWTKLIVVAIGFVGGLVFMYVQFKMYIALCRRWRAYNRVIYVQNIPDAVLSRSKDRLRLAGEEKISKEEKEEDVEAEGEPDALPSEADNRSRRQQQCSDVEEAVMPRPLGAVGPPTNESAEPRTSEAADNPGQSHAISLTDSE